MTPDAKELLETRIVEKERAVMLVHDAFTLGEGPEVLRALRCLVETQVPRPSVQNPNESLWYVEGQRSLVRWIESRIKIGKQIKAGESPYRAAERAAAILEGT